MAELIPLSDKTTKSEITRCLSIDDVQYYHSGWHNYLIFLHIFSLSLSSACVWHLFV
jgi:hypothetical protein